MRPLLLSLTLGLASLGSAKERPGDTANGKVVFEQCTACHNAGSTDKKMGPGLKGLFHKPKLQNGKKPAEPNVRARIDAGGGGMPPFKEMLTDQEKNDLIAYLKTL